MRRQAAVGLGIVSKHADIKITKVLGEACKDREATVREAAIRSLVAVDCGSKEEVQTWNPGKPHTMEAVGRAMQDPDALVRIAATQREATMLGQPTCVRYQ